MMEFSDFIFEQGLMDLPLAGGLFTWFNNQENPTWSCLDRFLVSSDWEVKFTGSLQKAFLDCVMIISRFFLIVEAFIGVPNHSCLRICG
jgi:hypothetical protein